MSRPGGCEYSRVLCAYGVCRAQETFRDCGASAYVMRLSLIKLSVGGGFVEICLYSKPVFGEQNSGQNRGVYLRGLLSGGA